MKPIMRDEENSIFKDTNHELEMFHVRKELRRRKGKVIVFTIATVNVVFAVFSFIISLDFITLISQITWAVLLYIGVSWARYAVAVGALLSAFFAGIVVIMGLVTPIEPGAANQQYYFTMVFWIIFFIYSLTEAILIFKNECVEEFLYNQKEDRNSI
ncbi:MAG: hypothetical protein FWF82_07005 [Oscillospiraceae bacterium]|nr:hypothetical protein [Oscillospiraceae bacterium]